MDHQNDNQSYSPYAAPTADTKFTPRIEDASFIPGGRSVSAGAAFSWISSSWELFRQQPGTWIGYIVALFGMSILLGYIPVVGDIVWMCIQPLLIAGVVYSCYTLRKEGAFVFADLFVAFQRKTGSLLITILIPFVFMIAMIFAMGLLIGFAGSFIGSDLFGSNLEAMLRNILTNDGIATILGAALLFIIIMIVTVSIFAMMLWFAPALVLMHDMAPFDAIKMSFSACLKNLLPGIVFFIMMSGLMLISIIPLFLGLLITVPMFFICHYTSYHSIFIDEGN